jgi:RND family efflux transporter MFP subunit
MIAPRPGLVALCAGLIAAAACGKGAPEEVDTVSAVPVTTAAAVRATITGTVHATGLVAPAPGAELVVVAPGAARVAEIPHAAGERVRRGDLLVRFDIPASAAEVRKQEAEVARAEAAIGTTRAARTRARELFDRGVAARKEVEDADRAAADAQAALAQARAALDAAQALAGRTTVRATFDGVIATRAHNPGDLVEAAAGDPVLRVVDPDRLEIVAAIPLSDATRVRVGAPAQLTSAATGTSGVALTVRSLPTAVDPGTATVPVRLGFVRAIRIPVGTPVQIDIAAETHRDVVTVPAAAIVREGDESAVFVVAGGTAHRHPVQVGLADGSSAEIVSGVAPGDRVIVDGQAGLPDGTPITERPPAAAADGRDGGR